MFSSHLKPEIEKRKSECLDMMGIIPDAEITTQYSLSSLAGGYHPDFPQLSSFVDIGDKGIVATKDFGVGDIVLIEKPFGIFLEKEFLDTHCFECGRKIIAAVPCDRCSKVRYCSDACRSESWESDHRIGCPAMNLLLDTGYPNSVFRTVTKFGVSTLMDCYAKLEGKHFESKLRRNRRNGDSCKS